MFLSSYRCKQVSVSQHMVYRSPGGCCNRDWSSPNRAATVFRLTTAEDMGLEVKQVLHVRDTKFTAQFDSMMTAAGAKIHKTLIQFPNLQAHVERVIQTLQQEVLDDFVVLSSKHLNHIVREGVRWFNNERGHSARNGLPPEEKTIRRQDVVCTTRLGGLLKHYSRQAA